MEIASFQRVFGLKATEGETDAICGTEEAGNRRSADKDALVSSVSFVRLWLIRLDLISNVFIWRFVEVASPY